MFEMGSVTAEAQLCPPPHTHKDVYGHMSAGMVRSAVPMAVFSCFLVWRFFLNTYYSFSYLRRKLLSGLKFRCCPH